MNRRDILSEIDEIWREDGEENGWVLPRVPWPLRLWGVRHVRFLWNVWRLENHVREMNLAGLGIFANPRDRWILWAIRRGWA
jgi:hypothetical protein